MIERWLTITESASQTDIWILGGTVLLRCVSPKIQYAFCFDFVRHISVLSLMTEVGTLYFNIFSSSGLCFWSTHVAFILGHRLLIFGCMVSMKMKNQLGRFRLEWTPSYYENVRMLQAGGKYYVSSQEVWSSLFILLRVKILASVIIIIIREMAV